MLQNEGVSFLLDNLRMEDVGSKVDILKTPDL